LDRKGLSTPGVTGSGILSTVPSTAQRTLLFAEFRLEADGSLFRGKTLIHLPPRELAALQLLLANPLQVVTTVQIKRALWGEVHVTADSVPKCLSSLRARLEPSECIQTVYKRGYRLTVEVREPLAPASNVLIRAAIGPFVSEMGVPEHLGPAMAEEAVARLSNLSRPIVSMLARDSVFALARRGMTAQQIGGALNADLVLTGTIRSITSHFCLRVEMVRISDGVQIWVEDMMRERDRIDELQDDLATRLVFRLDTELSRGRGTSPPALNEEEGTAGLNSRKNGYGSKKNLLSLAAMSDLRTEDDSIRQAREAYESYLRGRHEWQTFERHRMQDGLRLLAHASDLDPGLIGPKIDLSHLAVTQMVFGYMSSGVAAEIVRGCAESTAGSSERAAPILPDMGWVRFHVDRDLPGALRDFEMSSHLAHDPWITRVRTMFSLSRRRFKEAINMLQATLQQDPYSAWLHARLAWALHLDGQVDASVEQIDQAIRLFPEHEGPRLYGAAILAFNGQQARALKLAQDLEEQQPHFDLATSVHAYALACSGEPDEARKLIERLQWFSQQRFVLRSFNPAVLVALGDEKAALSELHAANEDRGPWFFQMLADPRLTPLHGNPEFEELAAILPAMEEEGENQNI
jgi:DNA-binding winged helix-turn-helix (wHTH) protein/tetratricopeptide (TPR) repeat protein